MSATRQLAQEIWIDAPPEPIFDFLAELANHWKIAGDRVVTDHRQIDQFTARVRFGPPGARRWATSRIERAERPRLIEGTATAGPSDGTVRWLLTPLDGGTQVRFEQQMRPGRLSDRILIVLARPWLERRYAAALRRLRERMAGERTG